MALSEMQAKTVAATLMETREEEEQRLGRITRYVRGRHSSVYVPKSAREEYRWIHQRSPVNILPLLVGVVAQNLYVDGYRPTDAKGMSAVENSAGWRRWQDNRMDMFQHGIHRAALTYGYSYTRVLRATKTNPDGTTRASAEIKPMSPTRMTAFYADEVLDEWPLYAIESYPERQDVSEGGVVEPKVVNVVKLYDDMMVYEFVGDIQERRLTLTGVSEHGTGFCPVVRYLNLISLDNDGSMSGEVEPVIPIQDQINVTTFNLLMAQQYAAHRQKWATGIAYPEDAEGRPLPFKPEIDRMMVAESPETRFGNFDATDLMGYLKSREDSIRAVAAISQLPPYQFLGTDNLASAEALAAARDGLDRKINERQSSFGESHEQTLRLAAFQEGDMAGWNDRSSQVVWRDTSTRAFAATVDGLGKLAQMLEVPVEALWEKIPGVTATDVERWQEIKDSQPDVATQLVSTLSRQNADLTSNGGTSDAAGNSPVPA